MFWMARVRARNAFRIARSMRISAIQMLIRAIIAEKRTPYMPS